MKLQSLAARNREFEPVDATAPDELDAWTLEEMDYADFDDGRWVAPRQDRDA